VASLASRFTQSLPASLAMLSLPVCANPSCLRPPTLWQRWWARHEGIHFEQGWYCCADCFASSLLTRVEALARPLVGQHLAQPRFPLGLILLEQRVISEQQLQKALACQRHAGQQRIGEWLIRIGAATEPDIISALAVQQNCPVFSKSSSQSFPAAMQFPMPLVRLYGGVPVYFSSLSNTLYLAFAGPLNRSVLRAAGQLMRCRIEPCMVSEGLRRLAVAGWETELRGEAVSIEQRQSTREMARAIAGYAEQAKASACSLARCEEYLWTRLYGDLGSLDLLFRVAPEDRLPSESDEIRCGTID
jgi:hypothetical protein